MNGYSLQNNPMEVTGLFEGDIVPNLKTKGIFDSQIRRWPNGIVYYVIDNSYSNFLYIKKDIYIKINSITKLNDYF